KSNAHTMTGKELRVILFKEYGSLTAFGKYVMPGDELARQKVSSRFTSQKVDIDILKKYAAWRGIPEMPFIQSATGDGSTLEALLQAATLHINWEAEPVTVNEPGAKYEAPPEPLTMQIVRELILVQREQNIALMKLANAAEINAKTIGKLNGINTDTDSNTDTYLTANQ